jgi:hypothetical protein
MKRHCVTITVIRWLVIFREITAVYSDNNTKPINALYGKNRVKLSKVA